MLVIHLDLPNFSPRLGALGVALMVCSLTGQDTSSNGVLIHAVAASPHIARRRMTYGLNGMLYQGVARIFLSLPIVTVCPVRFQAALALHRDRLVLNHSYSYAPASKRSPCCAITTLNSESFMQYAGVSLAQRLSGTDCLSYSIPSIECLRPGPCKC